MSESLKNKADVTATEVAETSTTDNLSALVERPSPKDPLLAATLLEKWLDVDPKPRAKSRKQGMVKFSDNFVFFDWLVANVGPEAYQSLEKRDEEIARRFRHLFLQLIDKQIDWYSHAGGACPAGPIARMLGRNRTRLKSRVLGTQDKTGFTVV